MESEKEEDQFLAFFVALEVVSDDVKPPASIKPTCKKCGANLPPFTSHLEGIKAVAGRHPDLPERMFDRLRKARAKIAHGELSRMPAEEIRRYLPLIEQLAAEAITISIGGDPDSVKTRGPMRMLDLMACGDITYDTIQNPHTLWKKSIAESIAILKEINDI